MVLFLHNRYRTTGGEERVVEDLMELVREQLGEQVELLGRDSASLSRGRAAAGLLRGGLKPEDVGRAVRLTGARVLHAHNLNPTLGWRALAAARAAGARGVLHLHQYRMGWAIGVCFTRGAECTRCHGRDTLPGIRLNCRANLPEAAAYGASLALWQRRLADQADAVIVPSVFARERLRERGARRARAGGSEVRFVGHVGDAKLAALRAGAAIALVPSRSAETFGLAAAEAMAAGLPVAASRVGALPELLDEQSLVPADDACALAEAIARLAGDRAAGARGLERVRALCAPETVAASLASIYDAAE